MNDPSGDVARAAQQRYRVGDLVVDGARRRVTRDETELPAAGLTFDLLFALVRAAPDFVSIPDLMQRVWPKLVVGPETVSQRVTRLRVALGDDAKTPRYVDAVRGRGYRVIAPVRVLVDAEASDVTVDLPLAAQTDSPVATSHRRPRSLPIAFGLIFVGLVAAAAIWSISTMSGSVIANAPRNDPSAKSAQALRLYQQAVVLSHSGSSANTLQAFDLLDQSIELDPRFARALALRARTRTIFTALGFVVPNALESAERDAGEAVGIDPDLPDAHFALALNDVMRGNWNTGDEHFRKAIALSPSDPELRAAYASFALASSGHLEQALVASKEAAQLAPESALFGVLHAAMYSLRGQDREALDVLKGFKPTQLPADAVPLPLIYSAAAARAGRLDEAATHGADALHGFVRESGGYEVMRKLYQAIARPADRPAARGALQELLHRIPRGQLDPVAANEFIQLLAQIDAHDDAFALINQVMDDFADRGTVGAAWGVLWTPEMRAFRRDPRFQQLVLRLKLPDYWRGHGPPDGCQLRGERLECS